MAITDRIIDRNSDFAKGTIAPMANAFEAGQNGALLKLGKYVQSSNYVSKSVLPFVIEFPRWVEFMPDPDIYRRAIKSWFEVVSRVEGLNKTLTAEFTETEIGSSGIRQFDVSRVIEQQSDITHSGTDKYGQPYKQLFSVWLRYGMFDPETRVPLISVINDSVTDHMADMYCASILYVEPDPLMKYPQNAWLCTNMAPRSNGIDEGSKDLTQGGQTKELSIQMTSMQQTTYGVLQFAQTILDQMNRQGLNTYNRPAFLQDIDADVKATTGGFFDGLNEATAG